MTGCPVGYRCAATIANGNVEEYCQRVENTDTSLDAIELAEGKMRGVANHVTNRKKDRKLLRGHDLIEEIDSELQSSDEEGLCSNATDAVHPNTFPRYSLCTLPPAAFEIVHGFPLKDGGDWELAYYSNMGSITTDVKADVRFVFISIHGSSRNADDYLCAAHSASRLQVRYPPESVLVVAPRFLAPEDGPLDGFRPSRGRGVLPLRWNETSPIPHTWRYGADSIQGGISSYAALDALLEHFALDPGGIYPNLETIVLAGHSAGGQLAQRYSLLSPNPILDARLRAYDRNTHEYRDRLVAFRTVVANPRSYCYLDGRRPRGGGYKVPTNDRVTRCPRYNQWQWGLCSGGDVTAPYKDRAIEYSGGVDKLKKRFLQRSVTYLAGSKDIIPLQGSCEDDLFQGGCRLERAQLYYGSLQALYNSTKHVFKDVKGSNHVSPSDAYVPC